MADSKLINSIVKEIERIAKSAGKVPALVTKAEFMASGKFTDWQLRKLGGLQGIINSKFPLEEKDLKEIARIKEDKSYVSKLESQYGKLDLFQEKLTEALKKELEKLEVTPIVLNEKKTKEHLLGLYGNLGKHSLPRSVVAIASDLHFGAIIDEELGGRNVFNWDIAAKRWAMFIQQIASYKIEARGSHEELHLLLLGDLIQGLIHDSDSKKCDLLSKQQAGLTKYLVEGIEYLQPYFDKITVSCTAGNHDRSVGKISKDRAMIDRDDSYVHPIFYFLSLYFKNNPKITINIPKTAYIDLTIQGKRLWANHGDTLVHLPNPSKNLSTAKLEMQINKINASEQEKGKAAYDIFCFGHIHQPAHLLTTVGTNIIINGCLVGLDQFAFNMGCAFTSIPTQTIFEVTKDYGPGDIRLVYVEKADKNTALTDIIKPYKYELEA
jgi:predicted phosphodiesterase